MKTTTKNYAEKCRQMKQHLTLQPMKLWQLALHFKGSYYFYATLLEKGFLVKGSDDNVRWWGRLPNEVEMRRIIRHCNTLSSKHRAKKTKKKYTKRSAYWNKFKGVNEARASLQTAIAEHISNNPPSSPTIDLFLRGIQAEIVQHRSNGADTTHLKNISELVGNMMKLI